MKPDYGTLPAHASPSELRQAKHWLAGARFNWTPIESGQTLSRPDAASVHWHVALFVGHALVDDCYVCIGDAQPKKFAEHVQTLLAVKCLRDCLAAA